MTVTAFIPGKTPANLLGGETAGESSAVDYLSNTIKVSLHTSSFSPDQDTLEFYSAVDNEVTGAGYDTGGATLSNKGITYTAGTNTVTLTCDPVTWADSTITARYAVVYQSTGNAATSVVLSVINFGQDMVSSAGNFTLTFASGVITLQVS